MLRKCKVCDGWHDLDEPWPHNCLPARNWSRSDLAAPMVIGDTIEPTQSMVDGKYYTSKAALRSTYYPSGNREGKRYIEVGNDSSVLNPKPKSTKLPKSERVNRRAALERAFSRAGLGA